jgi:hypothetical protein
MAESANAFSTIVHIKAGGTISAWHFVDMSGATVVQASSANTAIGVLAQADDAAANDIVPVCVMGPCKVFADGTSAIVIGAYIAAEVTTGHAIVDAGGAGDHIQGMALEALATGTAVIQMLVYPSQG